MIEVIILAVYAVIVKIVNCINSPIFSKYFTDSDQAIFYSIGKAIIDGKVLYKDVFDHKTPYIYFANAAASLLDYNHIGLYIIEVILLFISLYYTYRFLVFILSKREFTKFSQVISLVGALLMGAVLTIPQITFGYSRTEEYAVAFMMIALYIFTKFYYEKEEFKTIDMFIIGIMAGLTFMTNIRAIALYVPFAIVTLVILIKNKFYGNIIRIFFAGIFGVIISIIPYIIYMIVTDSMADMIYAVFTMNFEYLSSDVSATGGVLKTFVDAVVEHLAICIVLFLSFLIIVFKKYNIYLKISVAISFVIAFCYTMLTKRVYVYYFVIFMPYVLSIYCLIISFLFRKSQNLLDKKKFSFKGGRVLVIATAIILIIFIGLFNSESNINRYKNHTRRSEKMRNYVKEYFGDSKNLKVLGIGFNPEVYVYLDAPLEYKYFIIPIVSYKKNSMPYDAQYYYLIHRDPDVVIYRDDEVMRDYPNDIKNQIRYILKDSYVLIGNVTTNVEEGEYLVYGKKKS